MNKNNKYSIKNINGKFIFRTIVAALKIRVTFWLRPPWLEKTVFRTFSKKKIYEFSSYFCVMNNFDNY